VERAGEVDRGVVVDRGRGRRRVDGGRQRGAAAQLPEEPRAAGGAADIADADVGGTSGGAWLFRQLSGGATLATSVDASASASAVDYNAAIDFTGTFHNPGGGCLRDDTVSLHRSGPDGTFDLGPTEVAADGTFSFEDVPPTAGAYDYQVVFAGDGTHKMSSSDTMHVAVSKITTSLSLAATASVVKYGSSTTLKATLQGGVATSVVAFDRRTASGWKQIGTAEAGGDRVATLTVRPSGLSRYRAVYDPTASRKGSVSQTVTIEVRAVLENRMIGKGTRDGRYKVYVCCTAYFYAKLKPSHPGSKWVATVQYLGKRSWKPLGKATYKFERDGDAAIYLNAVKGYRYRVRARWSGDADHLGATGSWQYFRYR